MWLFLACSSKPAATAASPTSTPDPAPPVTASAPATGSSVVHVSTVDGVDLVADWIPAEGERGVILLHMIPPKFDRTAWPGAFIDGLHKAGFSVLNVDRRGAGASGGVAEEAYEGNKGKLDVQAASIFLRDHGVIHQAWIGASNGTTSSLDAAAVAAPQAMIWMSPGPYTENNTHLDAVKMPHLMVLSPEAEAPWPKGHAGSFEKLLVLPGNAHGTYLFADPSVQPAILAFLKKAIP